MSEKLINVLEVLDVLRAQNNLVNNCIIQLQEYIVASVQSEEADEEFSTVKRSSIAAKPSNEIN